MHPRATDGGPVVEAEGVRKLLGGVAALDGVDMVVTPGTVHALIGPNGSGKTTFLNVLSGYLDPDEGRVTLFGADAVPVPAHRRARDGLARTFQTPFVLEGATCLENVMTALDRTRRHSLVSYALRLPPARREERDAYQRAIDLLVAVGIGERADDPAGDLPPGERRLLELARVLALDPDLVLMDEPAAGLSLTEIEELVEVIGAFRQAGIAVVLVEHHVEVVMSLADEVTVLDSGRVIAHGPPAAVQRDPAVISAYLGTDPDAPSAADIQP